SRVNSLIVRVTGSIVIVKLQRYSRTEWQMPQRSQSSDGSAGRVSTAVQEGMPGGPRISMPYSAAVAANRSKSGGSVAGGGTVRLSAGSDRVRTEPSNPAGSVTSWRRAAGGGTVKVGGPLRRP